MFGPHAAGSIIVHTIHAGRFLFDCTVSLTAVCGQQKEGAVMVFILSKLKCFFRLLQSAALHCAESVYLSNALIHVCYGLLHILADTL